MQHKGDRKITATDTRVALVRQNQSSGKKCRKGGRGRRERERDRGANVFCMQFPFLFYEVRKKHCGCKLPVEVVVVEKLLRRSKKRKRSMTLMRARSW